MQEQRGWREIGQSVLKYWYSFWRARRLKDFRLEDILACPECHGALKKSADMLTCEACSSSYPVSPVPDFTPRH
jgi:hypothetical protein